MTASPLCCVYSDGLDEDAATALTQVLKAIADPVRLRVIALIASSSTGELCACELPALLGRTQSTVSYHLGQLVRAGVLEREQRGKWAWFRLTDRLEDVRAALGKGRC